MLPLLSALLAARAFALSLPPSYLDKLDSTPDLMQSLAAARLPYGGLPYCGPVAASNALVWLARNGFERLAPRGGGPEAQGELALRVSRTMGTTRSGGTLAGQFTRGLARYVRERGYRFSSLSYQGWEKVPREFSTGVRAPDIGWIKRGVVGKSAVWLKIGWYRRRRGAYHPFAGHWVTVVGYTEDSLVIHDPAPRSGPELSHDYVKLERLGGGEIYLGPRTRLRAADYYRLGGGLKIKEGADAGILEGAVVLRMD